MIRVEVPEKGVLEFPDGTPPAVIQYVAKRFAEGKAVSPRESEAFAQGMQAGLVDTLGRSLARGATFGFSDEIVAGLRSAFTGVPYREALAEERAINEGIRAGRPWMSTAGEVAGALVSPVARAIPVLAPASAGASLPTAAGRAIARGALAGGVGGAIAGAGEAGSNADIPEEMFRGGLIGAAAGGVLSAALSAGSEAAGRLLRMLGLRNPEPAAERQILRALDRDKIDLATLKSMKFAPDEALIDRAGMATRHLGATVANVPSKAMTVADDFVTARRYARPDRIATEIDSILGGGSGESVMRRVDALATMRARAAAPLYEKVREVRVPKTVLDDLDPMIKSEVGQRALRRGLAILEAEGRAAYLQSVRAGAPNPRLLFDPATVGVTIRDGKIEIQGRMQSLGLLDAIKRGLDDIVEQYRDPVTMRLNLTQEARAIAEMRDSFREILRNRFPIYGKALDAWSGPTRIIEAVAFGRDALRLDPDQIAKRVARMGPDEKQAMLLGLGRAIADMTSDPSKASSAVRRLFEDRTMQRRFEYLIPDRGQREALQQMLAREMNMAATERAVSPRAGSQTARLLAGKEDMAIDPPGGVVQALLEGHPVVASQRALGAVARGLAGNMPASTADALAMRLFVADPVRNAQVIEQLMQRAAADRAAAERWRPVLGAALAGSGAVATQQSR